MTDGSEGVGSKPEKFKNAKQAVLKPQFEDLPPKTQLDFWDAIIRRNIAYSIMGLFALVNLATLAFVYGLLRVDQADLMGNLIGPGDRVVNASAVMTLLGATTVQLGTAMLIMARFVFRPVDRGGLRAE